MILYFDIDGVLLDYDDRPKAALLNDALQNLFKDINVTRLVCVSNWTDIVSAGYVAPSESVQKNSIYNLLSTIFTDRDWFMSLLELTYQNDSRCRHIDVELPFLYIDDCADEYFTKQFGDILFRQDVDNQQVFLADPHSDGSDPLNWLANKRTRSNLKTFDS